MTRLTFCVFKNFTNYRFLKKYLKCFIFIIIGLSFFTLLIILSNKGVFTSILLPMVPDLDNVKKELSFYRADFLETTASQKYALMSINIDSNAAYFYHLPIAALAWRRVFYEPIFMIVYSDRSKSNAANNLTISYLNELNVKIFYFKAVDNFEITSSMVVRVLLGLLPDSYIKENDFILTSDVDLYPLNPKHYTIVNDGSIKLWNKGCCGYFEYNGMKYEMLPMGHIGMRKYQWLAVMDLGRNHELNGVIALEKIKEFYGEAHSNDKIVKGDDYWYVDQKMISTYVDRYVRSTRTKVDLQSKPDASRRIDRAMTKKKWARILSGNIEDYNDVHSMQSVDRLFSSYNLYQMLFEKIFSRRIAIFLDKYTLEFTGILNIKLDKNYKYLS